MFRSTRSIPSFLITDNGITLFVDGQHYAVSQDHINYGKIRTKLTAKDFDGLVELLDVRASVRQFLSTDPEFALVNDLIQFQDRAFSGAVTDKVLSLIEAGNDTNALFNFLRLVRKNPSAVAQDELLLFCVANNFMIDENGHIVAYKSVNENYTAIHDSKTFYKPAAFMTLTERNKFNFLPDDESGVTTVVEDGKTVVEMERNAVDDRRENTCSFGLHFASYEYASTWAGQDGKRLLVVAVSPADVVSIPNDYSNQKGRASKLTILSELPGFVPLPKQAVYDFNEPTEDGDILDFGSGRHSSDSLDEERLSTDRAVDEGSLDNAVGELLELQVKRDAAIRAHRPRSSLITRIAQVRQEVIDLCDNNGWEYPTELEV